MCFNMFQNYSMSVRRRWASVKRVVPSLHDDDDDDDDTRLSYDVTSIFQDGGGDIAILLPISFLATSLN